MIIKSVNNTILESFISIAQNGHHVPFLIFLKVEGQV